ncbi:MAG: hypothetical protein AVDCRST_MAG77-2822, partial [uncultured Chloroflexi bacterium]
DRLPAHSQHGGPGMAAGGAAGAGGGPPAPAPPARCLSVGAEPLDRGRRPPGAAGGRPSRRVRLRGRVARASLQAPGGGGHPPLCASGGRAGDAGQVAGGGAAVRGGGV